MEVRSIYKYARISAFKVREVTREIQGLPVSVALDVLAFTPKKAAFLINKTLKSAIANAENNANLKADGLVVKEAVVGEGPTFKRMNTRARGSGSRILKRTSHIRIVLTDEVPKTAKETKEQSDEKATSAAPKKAKKTKKTAKAAAKK
jgi:large subunit ribosomal protein L22